MSVMSIVIKHDLHNPVPDKLAYEMAPLKRLKFAAETEALNTDQRSLLEEALEEDDQLTIIHIKDLRITRPFL